MNNHILIAPWPSYTDSAMVSFRNSVSEPTNERHAKRLVCAMGCIALVLPDEETAKAGSLRGQEEMTLEQHAGFIAAAKESGVRFVTPELPPQAALQKLDEEPEEDEDEAEDPEKGDEEPEEQPSEGEATPQDEQPGGQSESADGADAEETTDPASLIEDKAD